MVQRGQGMVSLNDENCKPGGGATKKRKTAAQIDQERRTVYRAKRAADDLARLEATVDKYRGENDTQTMLKMAAEIRYLSHTIDTLVCASKYA